MAEKVKEEDKTFSCEIIMRVGRADTKKDLMDMNLKYANLTRGDAVAIQDVFAQASRMLVDLGYKSVELTGGPEAAAMVAATKAVIRGA